VSASHLYRHFTNPRFQVIWEAMEQHRGFGCAIRAHNGTVGEFPGGDAACWQGAKGTEWQSIFDGTGSPFDFVNQKNTGVAESISFKKGSYAFYKPVSLKDSFYHADTKLLAVAGSGSFSGAPGLPCALQFDLEGRTFAAHVIRVPELAVVGVPEQDITLYFGMTGQWTTNEQYWPQREGVFTLDDWIEGMDKIQSMMQITPNESHFARIGRILGSVGRWAGNKYAQYKPWADKLIEYAPQVLKVISAL